MSLKIARASHGGRGVPAVGVEIARKPCNPHAYLSGSPAMPPESSFAVLLDRPRQAAQEAARRIFDTFARRLIGLARSRLDGAILRKVGAEDVVQSALLSFFRRDAVKPFDLANWDNLWSLLAVITLRKCGHQVEHYRAACRAVSLEAGKPASAGDESAASWVALARDPTPSEGAMLADTLGQLLDGLDEREASIVRLTLEGRSVAEISRTVGRSEYLVRKVVSQVKDRWQRACEWKSRGRDRYNIEVRQLGGRGMALPR